jgi:microcystin-dependent protein
MATGVTSWSQTAASNANADSTVNFAEGMAPSAVNDSSRALMASVAKYRDDLSGSITTGGTSTAYTVTSNQGLALTAGYMVAFAPHATNGATVTINVDSLGAKPLRSAPGVELAAGVLVQGTPYALVQGTPYAATYYTTNSGEWILHGFYGNPYNVPIGGMMPYLSSTAPNSSFVLPYGQAISRTTYATLFSLIGTTFGTGDGSTTFNIIDMRGRLPVGKDDMGGTAASRVTTAGAGIDGTTMGAAGGAQTHTLTSSELPVITPTGSIVFSGSGTSGNTFLVVNNSVSNGASSGSGATSAGSVVTDSATFSGNSFGGGAAHAIMQPSIIVPWILRVV